MRPAKAAVPPRRPTKAALVLALVALAVAFRTKRHNFADAAEVTRLRKRRKALVDRHRGAAGQPWGFDACMACKTRHKSFVQCRGSGAGYCGHDGSHPDAGASIAVGVTVTWSLQERSQPFTGVVTGYHPASGLHHVDVKLPQATGIAQYDLVSNSKRLVVKGVVPRRLWVALQLTRT